MLPFVCYFFMFFGVILSVSILRSSVLFCLGIFLCFFGARSLRLFLRGSVLCNAPVVRPVVCLPLCGVISLEFLVIYYISFLWLFCRTQYRLQDVLGERIFRVPNWGIAVAYVFLQPILQLCHSPAGFLGSTRHLHKFIRPLRGYPNLFLAWWECVFCH